MVLAQRQKYRSMEQNRKPRDKSTPYGHLIFNIFFKSTLQENTLVWLPIRVLYQDVIPSSDYFSSLRKKQAFRLKQQFVTKTLIPRILTKHITNDSMEKILAQYLKVQLYNVPLNWRPQLSWIVSNFQIKNVTKSYVFIYITQWNYEPTYLNSLKLWTMPCKATQDRCVMVKNSDKTWWSTGGGMANHSSILAFRTPWTVWKGKKTWHWKMNSPDQ